MADEPKQPKKLADMTGPEIVELAKQEEKQHRARQKHLKALARTLDPVCLAVKQKK